MASDRQSSCSTPGRHQEQGAVLNQQGSAAPDTNERELRHTRHSTRQNRHKLKVGYLPTITQWKGGIDTGGAQHLTTAAWHAAAGAALPRGAGSGADDPYERQQRPWNSTHSTSNSCRRSQHQQSKSKFYHRALCSCSTSFPDKPFSKKSAALSSLNGTQLAAIDGPPPAVRPSGV